MVDFSLQDICINLQELAAFYCPNSLYRKLITHSIKTMVTIANYGSLDRITTVSAIMSTQIFSDEQMEKLVEKLGQIAIQNPDRMKSDVIEWGQDGHHDVVAWWNSYLDLLYRIKH